MKRINRLGTFLASAIIFSQTISVFAAEPSAWAKDTIKKAEEKNITVYTNRYQDSISRHDMAYLVSSLLTSELGQEFANKTSSDKQHPFGDVEYNHFPVNLCYSTKIMQGTSPNKFSPKESLTREQSAAILVRAIQFIEKEKNISILNSSSSPINYKDNEKISNWAQSTVKIATNNKIMQGSGGYFYPQNNISFEEAIVLTYNANEMFNSFGLSGSYSQSEINKMIFIAEEYSRIKKAVSDVGSDIYNSVPNKTSPYSLGSVKENYIQLGIDNVNLARYIADLPNNVRLASDQIENVQAASVLLDRNGSLSHSPSKPSDMSESFYKAALSGAGTSNLSWGSGIPNSVWSYMNDSDSSNIDRVGHRRWILNQTMGETAFGQSGTFSAMYAFDDSGSKSSREFVAWPNGVFPMQEFSENLAWSVSVPASYIQNDNNVSVELTRKRDNKTWTINNNSNLGSKGYFNIDKAGYGRAAAIIFRFDSEPDMFLKEDSFDVKINGLSIPVNYNVKLFSVEELTKIKNTIPNGLSSSSNSFSISANQSSSSNKTDGSFSYEYKDDGFTNDSINQGMNQSSNQGMNQSIDQETNQIINQGSNQGTNQSSNQETNQIINQGSNQGTNQTSNQSSNQSINQSEQTKNEIEYVPKVEFQYNKKVLKVGDIDYPTISYTTVLNGDERILVSSDESILKPIGNLGFKAVGEGSCTITLSMKAFDENLFPGTYYATLYLTVVD